MVKIKTITTMHPGGCRHRKVTLSNGKEFIFHDRNVESLAEVETDPEIRMALAWFKLLIDDNAIDVWTQLNGVTLGGRLRRSPLGSTLAVSAGAGV